MSYPEHTALALGLIALGLWFVERCRRARRLRRIHQRIDAVIKEDMNAV